LGLSIFSILNYIAWILSAMLLLGLAADIVLVEKGFREMKRSK